MSSIETTPSTALTLRAAERAQIERWAQDAYPHEACGLLLGRLSGDRVTVEHVRSAPNLDRAHARDRYELDPAAHLAAAEEARALGLDVVGVWHSHPDLPARPSETDRAEAWSGWSYVIVSAGASRAGELRSWRLHGDRFAEEEVVA